MGRLGTALDEVAAESGRPGVALAESVWVGACAGWAVSAATLDAESL